MTYDHQHKDLGQSLHSSAMVGQSAKMHSIFELIAQVAPTDMPVLVEGETGTGKELVARAIHANSLRKDKAFVAVDCAALPDGLLESELFGYRRGAFTGATEGRMGLLAQASGATLFLDEIANASCPMQAKLLRVIEEGQIRRIGENDLRKVDVRVICATNVRLGEAVVEGRFRKDLYYRVSGFHVVLPPLRERLEDIPLLVAHFLQRSCAKLAKGIHGVTEEAMSVLLRHDWPGNVRELEHCLEAAILVCQNSLISPAELRLSLQEVPGKEGQGGTFRQYEKDLILRVVQECHGNKRLAARTLGISPNTLYRKLRWSEPLGER